MSNRQYAVNANGDTRPPVKLRYITAARYDKDWHSTPHTHHFSEFFFVLHGEGRFLVDNTAFEVKENDMVIVNPHVEHTERSLQDSPLEYVVLGVEGVTFAFGQLGAASSYRLYNYQANAAQIRSYLKAMLREAETEQPFHEIICQNLLEVTLSLIHI